MFHYQKPVSKEGDEMNLVELIVAIVIAVVVAALICTHDDKES